MGSGGLTGAALRDLVLACCNVEVSQRIETAACDVQDLVARVGCDVVGDAVGFGQERVQHLVDVCIGGKQRQRLHQIIDVCVAMRAFVLMMPKARLLKAVPAVLDMIEAPLDLSSEPFRLLQAYLGLFNAGVDLNDAALARSNADYVLDLIALSLSGRGAACEAACERGLPKTRLAVILAEIERNVADPKLSGKIVAARVGITERYLQQLMESQGETFSRYLLRLRLDKAAGMLVAKPLTRVSEVAFQCGFNDLSYFNRSFKTRFGESPRTYRR